MKQITFNRYLSRDWGCLHCSDLETAVPHHRLNRGMGGSKERDRPSNIITLCSFYNGLIESDSFAAERAREMGWKLRNGQNPATIPVWVPRVSSWVLLDDGFNMNLFDSGRASPVEGATF
jgi:hypothetical protein